MSGDGGRRGASDAGATGFRRYLIDGFEVLVGKGARDNDRLTFRHAAPTDLWLHAAGYAGSHVVVRRGEDGSEAPRGVVEKAAELAAHHSKARDARGKVEVHLCRVADVRKPPGFPAGKVELRRWESIRIYPRDRFREPDDRKGE